MNIELILGVGAIVGVLMYLYKTYNELTYHQIAVERQTAHIDVHLKKKFDLIPALADVVKGYAKHERGTFEEVTKLRSQWGAIKDTDKKVRTANQIENALSKLLVVHERYPKLKANKTFQSIQKSISRVEKELVHERKLYNRRVSSYDIRLRLFPKNIVAKLFGFKEKEFYQVDK